MHCPVVAYDTYITFQFSTTPKVSSLSADKFHLWTTAATPSEIVAPWVPINLSRDYNSISRILRLYFAVALPTGSYEVRGVGLLNAAGQPLPTTGYLYGTFSFASAATPIVALPPAPPPVYVEDKSIRGDVFASSEAIYEPNPNFYIVSTDPDQDEPIVEPNYANGRVTFKFSAYPNSTFLTSTFFKVQRKKLGREFNRWETVPVNRSLDASYPYVYIDFPSADATPVYYSADATPAYDPVGKTYFESGYKYRIRISRNVGI